MIDPFELQRLSSQPIEPIAERLGLRVAHHKALCPFHADKHPSLTFKGSRYRCFVCGAQGGVIDLVKNVSGKKFVEACKWIADENKIIIPDNREPRPLTSAKVTTSFDATRYIRHFEHPWLSPYARQFLFEKRMLDPRVVDFCRLTSYKDWLQIPYLDQAGRLIGIQCRYMGSDPNQPRFRFPQGSVCKLYNQQVIPMLKPGEPLFISEGCSDCWSILSSGHKCVAIPSATLLKEEDLLPLQGHSCHIYPDQDEPGEKLYERLLAASLKIGFYLERHQLPSGCKDFSDYFVLVKGKGKADEK
ncbi:MAG: CHC2 zinc finger domain-containing protein [Bacteroidales bacterium]|nr:CHC2 zinc finger domain-containing protein [Bacteroidales bacterium]